MPSKHVDDKTWRLIEVETLKVIKTTNKVFKETDILKALILKGLEVVEPEDYEQLLTKSKK